MNKQYKNIWGRNKMNKIKKLKVGDSILKDLKEQKNIYKIKALK
jgi:hypothetical protein